ncbi:fructose-2,6-bisphosphatase [Halalkalibacter wakoensis JCM 9140]|uniref:Fructose-2,6-bisphosphatase n=1 Tax=Halalkalibacter wakoensis JCM 9140 TaxID=1236970 RepID=W4Q615_9BACI|nr:histidine phosphatase family protein [Halalkalibacter wakoensis]GAE27400.1 fructose-2,6-bisphosphatase [Halalkalibacter wakoensis JCM 9140]
MSQHDYNTGDFFLSERSLPQLLSQGGYTLYSRHAEATIGVDQPNLDFTNCQTQRNLSENGRNQAHTYGETLRRLNIPIMTPVVASPFCRTRETAAIAFGEGSVYVDPFWVDVYNLSFNVTPAQQQTILHRVQSILETQPQPGTNGVIIAHSFPANIGLGPIPDMGTVVIRPRGQGNGYEVVAHVEIEEMANWGV